MTRRRPALLSAGIVIALLTTLAPASLATGAASSSRPPEGSAVSAPERSTRADDDATSSIRTGIAFRKEQVFLTRGDRRTLARLLASIPPGAGAVVTVSGAVARGRATADDRALANQRAKVTAKALRRLADRDERIASVRVDPVRTVATARDARRVEIEATWRTAITRPSQPTDVNASAGLRSIAVSWQPPEQPGTTEPLRYDAYAIEGRERPFDWTPSVTDPTCSVDGALECTITDVVVGRGYTVAVIATNAAGSSESSAWPYGPIVPFGQDSAPPAGLPAPTQTDPDPPQSVPGAPGTPTATAGDTTSVLTWSAPTSGGGSVTSYVVERSLFGGPFAEQPGCTGLGNVLTCTATGLINGTSARFRVAAVNSAGQGDWSGVSATITPYGVPGAPVQPTAIAGVASAEIFWNAPSDNGSPLTGYVVSQRVGSSGAWSVVTGACGEYLDYPNETSCTLTGLTPGDEYFYRVRATNARGEGADSVASVGVTPTSNSSAPLITAVTAGDQQLTVDYTVTASGGETVWSRHSSDDGANWSSWTDSGNISGTLTIGSLANGTTYEVQLGLAVPPATPTTLVSGTATGRPGTVPGAPTSVVGTARNGFASVSWTAPTSDGGSALVGYYVEVSTTGTGSWLPATGTCAPSITTSSTSAACNAQGLTNGTTYYFRVTAMNSLGASTPSSASAGVTPIGPPDTPPAPTGQGSSATEIIVSWAAPATNGTAVTGYEVRRGLNSYGPFNQIATGLCSRLITESSATTSCTDTVDSAGPYYYTVTALSAAGASPRSAPSGAISPLPSPSAPDITAITPGNGSLSVAFSYSGTATNVQYSTNGGSTWTTRSPSATSSPVSITGLTNGTTYAVVLRMVTASGLSAASDTASGTPRTTPSAPVAPTGTTGNNSVTLTWSAPSDDGGALITGYIVQSSTDGTNYSNQAGCDSLGVDFTCVATGLTAGTAYTFKVAAINAAGTGTYSAASSALTPRVATCATGGVCKVGETGPGGGTVFYVASTLQTWGQYLEVAPSSWNGGAEPRVGWSGSSATVSTGTAIGTGAANTTAIIAVSSTVNKAATSARAYSGGGKTDWFLPSRDELIALSKSGQGRPFNTALYWSSSQATSSSSAFAVAMSNQGSPAWPKSTNYWVRPIRAFAPL